MHRCKPVWSFMFLLMAAGQAIGQSTTVAPNGGQPGQAGVSATSPALSAQALAGRVWQPLARDGIHDPTNPGLARLQEPGRALSALSPDTAGNLVRWVDALERGQIQPRASILPGTRVEVKDGDILLNLKGGTPIVRFPHRQHTLWLDCSNCHDQLFKPKIGANTFSMLAILQGEQCGVCHGAVSFPLTECNRCHSVPRRAVAPAAARAAQPAAAPAALAAPAAAETPAKAPP